MSFEVSKEFAYELIQKRFLEDYVKEIMLPSHFKNSSTKIKRGKNCPLEITLFSHVALLKGMGFEIYILLISSAEM